MRHCGFHMVLLVNVFVTHCLQNGIISKEIPQLSATISSESSPTVSAVLLECPRQPNRKSDKHICEQQLMVNIRVNPSFHIEKVEKFLLLDEVYDPKKRTKAKIMSPYLIEISRGEPVMMYPLEFTKSVKYGNCNLQKELNETLPTGKQDCNFNQPISNTDDINPEQDSLNRVIERIADGFLPVNSINGVNGKRQQPSITNLFNGSNISFEAHGDEYEDLYGNTNRAEITRKEKNRAQKDILRKSPPKQELYTADVRIVNRDASNVHYDCEKQKMANVGIEGKLLKKLEQCNNLGQLGLIKSSNTATDLSKESKRQWNGKTEFQNADSGNAKNISEIDSFPKHRITKGKAIIPISHCTHMDLGYGSREFKEVFGTSNVQQERESRFNADYFEDLSPKNNSNYYIRKNCNRGKKRQKGQNRLKLGTQNRKLLKPKVKVEHIDIEEDSSRGLCGVNILNRKENLVGSYTSCKCDKKPNLNSECKERGLIKSNMELNGLDNFCNDEMLMNCEPIENSQNLNTAKLNTGPHDLKKLTEESTNHFQRDNTIEIGLRHTTPQREEQTLVNKRRFDKHPEDTSLRQEDMDTAKMPSYLTDEDYEGQIYEVDHLRNDNRLDKTNGRNIVGCFQKKRKQIHRSNTNGSGKNVPYNSMKESKNVQIHLHKGLHGKINPTSECRKESTENIFGSKNNFGSAINFDGHSQFSDENYEVNKPLGHNFRNEEIKNNFPSNIYSNKRLLENRLINGLYDNNNINNEINTIRQLDVTDANKENSNNPDSELILSYNYDIAPQLKEKDPKKEFNGRSDTEKGFKTYWTDKSPTQPILEPITLLENVDNRQKAFQYGNKYNSENRPTGEPVTLHFAYLLGGVENANIAIENYYIMNIKFL